MRVMESAPSVNLNGRHNVPIDDDFVEESFTLGIAFMKTQVEYIFRNDAWASWHVSTFSKKIKHSSIMADGSNSDKRRSLSTINFRNQKRPRHPLVPI